MLNTLLINTLQIDRHGPCAVFQCAFTAPRLRFERVNNAEIKIASSVGFVTFSSPLRGELREGKTALIVCGSCERRRPQQHQIKSRVPRDGSPDGELLTKGKL
jgi:hypothetical protein